VSVRTRCWIGLLTLALVACGRDEPTGPGGPRDDDSGGTSLVGVLASGPVPRSAAPGADGLGGSLVFVAATPASVRGAKYARLVSSRGDSATAFAFDGGFDPLPVQGEEGDEVTVTVVDSAGRETTTRLPVRAKPPRVVRTSPAAQRTDVPLNIRIAVVFSAPMDAASVAAGVRLLRNGVVVPAEVRLSPDGLAAEVVPATSLTASANYELRIDSAVRDLLGSPLEQAAIASFRTGTFFATARAVEIMAWNTRCFDDCGAPFWWVGDSLQLFVREARSDGYHIVTDLPVQWSSDDPDVLAVSPVAAGFAMLRKVGPGRTTVRARVVGATGAWRPPPVYRRLADGVLTTTYVHVDGASGADRGIWRVRLDGQERELLFSMAELPADSTRCTTFAGDCYVQPDEFDVTPAGRIAVTRASDVGGVWVKDSRLAPLRRVTSPLERGAAHGPAWSLDGERLAYWFDLYADAMTELRVVDADGTGQRTVLRIPYDTTSSPPGLDPFLDPAPRRGGAPVVWHADGARLLMWSPQGTQQVSMTGSGMSLYLAGYLAGPWFADGGTQLVFDVLWSDSFFGTRPGSATYRASRQGVVDPASVFLGDDHPIAISDDGRLVTDGLSIYSADRAAACCRLGGILGFAK
jgi:hypothetical protein